MADHFGKNFNFDLQTFFEEQTSFKRSLPVVSSFDPVVPDLIHKKSERYLNLFFAYAENYAFLNSESDLFDRFLAVYGERLTRRFFVWHERNEVNKQFDKAISLIPK